MWIALLPEPNFVVAQVRIALFPAAAAPTHLTANPSDQNPKGSFAGS
jgi:hypothetical protein